MSGTIPQHVTLRAFFGAYTGLPANLLRGTARLVIEADDPSTGKPIDVLGLSARQLRPDGGDVTIGSGIVRNGVGRYSAEITFDIAGEWRFEVSSIEPRPAETVAWARVSGPQTGSGVVATDAGTVASLPGNRPFAATLVTDLLSATPFTGDEKLILVQRDQEGFFQARVTAWRAILDAITAAGEAVVDAAIGEQVEPAVTAELARQAALLIDPKVKAAGDSATLAGQKADAAAGSAGAASASAGAALASQTVAGQRAQEAAGSAATSGTKAGEASGSATTATNQAGIATTKAGEADASAKATAAILAGMPALIPLMTGFLYSFRLGRYVQEWGASRATIPQALADVLAVARASAGGYFDATGAYVQAANNAPRISFDPATLQPRGLLLSEVRTNTIQNPWFVGAVAGSPGTNPTGMSGIVGTTQGVTRSIVGVGTVPSGPYAGLPYLDVNFNGTATGASGVNFFFDSAGTPAANGETWTLSPILAVVSGTPGNLTALSLAQRMTASDGTVLGGAGIISANLALTGTLTRYPHTATLNQAATANLYPVLRFIPVVNTAYNETLRIVLGNLEKAPAASTPILPPQGTRAASTRLADATLVPDLARIGFNNGAQTFAARFRVGALPPVGQVAGIFRADDGTENERFRAFINPDGTVTAGVAIGGVVTQATTLGAVTPDTEVRIAAAFGDRALKVTLNGGAIASAVPAGRPYAMNRLRLGSADPGGAASMLNGALAEFAGRQGLLSDADLMGLLA